VLGERECQSVICSNVPGLGAIKSLAVLSIDHVAVSSFWPLGGVWSAAATCGSPFVHTGQLLPADRSWWRI